MYIFAGILLMYSFQIGGTLTESLVAIENAVTRLYQTTSAPRPSPNITVDTLEDTNTTDWTISKASPSFLEYYQNNQEFIKAGNNASLCAYDFVADASSLSDVNGIWATCQHEVDGCEFLAEGGCYPIMKFSEIPGFYFGHRTVKLRFALKGLAIVRLSFLKTSGSICFDFSLRKDLFSKCTFMNATGENSNPGWINMQSELSAYDNIAYSSFSFELIARFKGDVALIDKIEATSLHLCGSNENCTTTPTGPGWSSTTPLSTSPTTTPVTTTEEVITDPEVVTKTSTTKTTTSTTKPSGNVASSQSSANFLYVSIISLSLIAHLI